MHKGAFAVMNNFERIKTEYRIRALILSASLSLCCGVFVGCALLLISKLVGFDLLWVYYLLAGLGVALAAFGAFYFIFRPNAKRLARRLDEEYALGEKAQTMLEYSEDGSVMARLQREQTDHVLAPVAAKKLRFKGLVQYVFVPLLALAMLFTAIFIPARQTSVVAEEEPYEITEYQKASVMALIADVQSSDLEEDLITGINAILSVLVDSLESSALQSEMRTKVVGSVVLIDAMVAERNTYLELAKKLVDYPYVSDYAYALSSAANSYKSAAYKLSSMDSVREKQSVAEEKAYEELNYWLTDFATKLPDKDEEDNRDDIEVMSEKLNLFASGVKQGTESFIGEYADKVEEKLYSSVLSTGVAAEGLYTTAAGYNSDSLKAQTVSVLGKFISDSSKPLAKQSYNLIMNDYVRTRLAAIFGVTLPEWVTQLRKKPSGGGEEGGGEEDEGGGNAGAGGTGEVLFGSDDLVYDPETDRLVKYTQIVKRYREIIHEKTQSGASTVEVEQCAYKYIEKICSTQTNK